MISADAILNARILIVDDLEANVKVLEFLLRGAGYRAIFSTMDARTVVERHRTQRFDIIVLDLNMPHMSGFQVLDGLKEIEPEGYVPVLVMTAEPGHKLRALAMGAKDFLSKPFDHLEALTRIRNLLEVRLLYTASRDYGERLARYDSVTGLANRATLHALLAQAAAHARAQDGAAALLVVDIDDFKAVNDTLGHAAGDVLLQLFAQRLQGCVRERDSVARIGGNAFAIVASDPAAADGASPANGADCADALAQCIALALRPPFVVDGHELDVRASVGIAVCPDDGDDAATLMRYADTAMHDAKHAGRGLYRFFTAAMNARAQHRLELDGALRRAVAQGQFVLHYQPKVQLASGAIIGAEALIRWNRPGTALAQPGEFIDALEASGLIVEVGAWVIDSVCRQLAAWNASGMAPLHIALNVSARQFADGKLEATLLEAIRVHGVAPELLELEITESALMVDVDAAVATLQAIKRLGIHIAIDDFGTGYSSLAYLKRFPIDALKIDIAFIRDVTTNPEDAAIVRAIIAMAHSLGMDVVAEGVETLGQLGFLRRQHCDVVQGYLVSRAVAPAAFAELLAAGVALAPPDAASAPPTLLIVDDEVNIVRALVRLFHRDGYRLLTAASAAEALELLALNEVHVILCDERMPNMSGTEFLDRVKDLYPATFRIILSGYTDVETILDAINRGALYRFYVKPWDNDALRANIQLAFRNYWQLNGQAPP